MKTIEVLVSPQGETQLQTKGYAGGTCREASRFLERALGTVTADTPTPEVYQPQAEPERLRQAGG